MDLNGNLHTPVFSHAQISHAVFSFWRERFVAYTPFSLSFDLIPMFIFWGGRYSIFIFVYCLFLFIFQFAFGIRGGFPMLGYILGVWETGFLSWDRGEGGEKRVCGVEQLS